MLTVKIIVFLLLTLIISSIVKYFLDFTEIKSHSYLYMYIIIFSTIAFNFLIFNQIFYKKYKVADFSIVHPAYL